MAERAFGPSGTPEKSAALNRYNRRTTKGRAMGVVLSIETESCPISVIDAKVRPQDAGD